MNGSMCRFFFLGDITSKRNSHRYVTTDWYHERNSYLAIYDIEFAVHFDCIFYRTDVLCFSHCRMHAFSVVGVMSTKPYSLDLGKEKREIVVIMNVHGIDAKSVYARLYPIFKSIHNWQINSRTNRADCEHRLLIIIPPSR